jgi:hypothetical protein
MCGRACHSNGPGPGHTVLGACVAVREPLRTAQYHLEVQVRGVITGAVQREFGWLLVAPEWYIGTPEYRKFQGPNLKSFVERACLV